MDQESALSTPPVTTASLLRQLAAEFGAAAVLTGDAIAGPYVEDWSRDRTGRCLAVLRPDSVQAVSRIFQLCATACTLSGRNTARQRPVRSRDQSST